MAQTLTARQRNQQPRRFRRKDARTKLLRAIYGQLGTAGREPPSCTQAEMATAFATYAELTCYPPERLRHLLNQINKHGSHDYAMSDILGVAA